jgi:hypothetical protein
MIFPAAAFMAMSFHQEKLAHSSPWVGSAWEGKMWGRVETKPMDLWDYSSHEVSHSPGESWPNHCLGNEAASL